MYANFRDIINSTHNEVEYIIIDVEIAIHMHYIRIL